MKGITPTFLALAVTVFWAIPAAAQSANRTGPPATKPPVQGPVTAGPPESPEVRRCRLHCDSLDATAQRPQRSVAEKAARKDACAKKMVS